MEYEAVIGLEVHAELETQSKMFCGCRVVDPASAPANSAVCPVCAGMPGVLPVVNQRAIEFALRVALALDCTINHTSLFARKNYFYPDLPKGYQISQYEQPLARQGLLTIQTSLGEKTVRIRRVHLEEDTGKLTHVTQSQEAYSLIDLNRAGVPLLEIVTEPDLHSAEEVRAYAVGLRSLLRYVGVNSGDMQKGVMRIEPNISVRTKGSPVLGTRVEIKNLNSFKALERSVAYEFQRQVACLEQGLPVRQETVGWDVVQEITFTQRVKEGEDDYRYFPEPDLPPLVLDPAWVEQIRASLPELPASRLHRFQDQFGLNEYDAGVLVAEQSVADYFEATANAALNVPPKTVANWVSGELFGLLNQAGLEIGASPVSSQGLAELLVTLERGLVNQNTAKNVLAEMFSTGQTASQIISQGNLGQISDTDFIGALITQVLAEHTSQVQEYQRGKESIQRWLFGQVMRQAQGRANPQVVQAELNRQLAQFASSGEG